MTTQTKFIHKCRVYWDINNQIWVVEDKACGEISENRNWRRAVYLGIYHFKLELALGMSKVISETK